MYYVASDPLSLVLYGLAVLIFLASIAIQIGVKSTFNRYNQVKNSRGITGAQAAQSVLHKNGVYDCRVEMISGELTDHYDPTANVIRLSEAVYKSDSVAAVGVAAHEAGHAVQYATEYGPVRIRTKIIPAMNFASRFSWILIFLGFLLDVLWLGSVGVALFAVTTLFYLITLPVELDASRRALEAIGDPDMLGDEEKAGAKKVLTMAALTYVAALAASIVSLLRLILSVSRRD